MTLILDTGAWIAVEKADRGVMALLKRELVQGRAPLTHGGVVAQYWRGGAGRQAPAAKLLEATEVAPLDRELGRRAGVLMGRAGTADAVDAAVALLARDGDVVLSSDPADLAELAAHAGLHVDVVRV